MKRLMVLLLCLVQTSITLTVAAQSPLPRARMTDDFYLAMDEYLSDMQQQQLNIQSLMVVKDGKVVYEKWMNGGKPDLPHIMWSVSKTFTATAVGFAVTEGKLSLNDRVISFFPDLLPEKVSKNLKKMTIWHLMTMTCGHISDPTGIIKEKEDLDWAAEFLKFPVEAKPGTYFQYNTLGSYMLSAIVQRVTGEKIVDYLQPRLFEPLGIDAPEWLESPQGINAGGFGLYLKTEDMAKFGVMLLNEGKYEGKQILPASWVKKAVTRKVSSVPGGYKIPKEKRKQQLSENDWFQGYCFQMWRCRHHAVRADGMRGQYIVVIPEKNAVVVNTADLDNMPAELQLIWDHILPEL